MSKESFKLINGSYSLFSFYVGSGQGDPRRANTPQGPIIGGPFTLLDTEKRTVTEHDLLGNWVLLYFGYTSSPDLGPDQVHIMAKTIDILGSALLPTPFDLNEVVFP